MYYDKIVAAMTNMTPYIIEERSWIFQLDVFLD
jgi:hypothetical protein